MKLYNKIFIENSQNLNLLLRTIPTTVVSFNGNKGDFFLRV